MLPCNYYLMLRSVSGGFFEAEVFGDGVERFSVRDHGTGRLQRFLPIRRVETFTKRHTIEAVQVTEVLEHMRLDYRLVALS